MRNLTALFIAAIVSISLVPAASAETTRDRILRDVHQRHCPDEKPCNWCQWPDPMPTYPHGECGPVAEAHGSPCRCPSRSGWQKGRVVTFKLGSGVVR